MTLDNRTAVDPQAALGGASQLTAAGDRLLSRWQSLRAKIDELNHGAPWGKDEVGRQFNKNYLEGGEQAPATNVLNVGESLVKSLATAGPVVTGCVQGTIDVDDLTKLWFGKQ